MDLFSITINYNGSCCCKITHVVITHSLPKLLWSARVTHHHTLRCTAVRAAAAAKSCAIILVICGTVVLPVTWSILFLWVTLGLLVDAEARPLDWSFHGEGRRLVSIIFIRRGFCEGMAGVGLLILFGWNGDSLHCLIVSLDVRVLTLVKTSLWQNLNAKPLFLAVNYLPNTSHMVPNY